jgi:hypothetical protein
VFYAAPVFPRTELGDSERWEAFGGVENVSNGLQLHFEQLVVKFSAFFIKSPEKLKGRLNFSVDFEPIRVQPRSKGGKLKRR